MKAPAYWIIEKFSPSRPNDNKTVTTGSAILITEATVGVVFLTPYKNKIRLIKDITVINIK